MSTCAQIPYAPCIYSPDLLLHKQRKFLPLLLSYKINTALFVMVHCGTKQDETGNKAIKFGYLFLGQKHLERALQIHQSLSRIMCNRTATTRIKIHIYHISKDIFAAQWVVKLGGSTACRTNTNG